MLLLLPECYCYVPRSGSRPDSEIYHIRVCALTLPFMELEPIERRNYLLPLHHSLKDVTHKSKLGQNHMAAQNLLLKIVTRITQVIN